MKTMLVEEGVAVTLAAGVVPNKVRKVLRARPKLTLDIRTPEIQFPSGDAALAWTLSALARTVSIRREGLPHYNQIQLYTWVVPPIRGPPSDREQPYMDILETWFRSERCRGPNFRLMLSCERYYDPNLSPLFFQVHNTNKLSIRWVRGGFSALKQLTQPLLSGVRDEFDRLGPAGVSSNLERSGCSYFGSTGQIVVRRAKDMFDYHAGK